MQKVKSFTQSKQFRLALIGLGIAACGVGLGFAGWYVLNSRVISEIGFYLTVFGIAITFIGIILGQIRYGRDAIENSLEAAKKLKDNLSVASHTKPPE